MTDLARPDASALLARTRTLIDAGRLVAARPLLAALGRLDPSPARLAELTARLMMREGRAVPALEVLDAAIPHAEADANLRKLRADVRLQTGDLPGAAADAAEAVTLDRTDPDAKALLGTLLIELGLFDDAATCLQEALLDQPANASYWLALAEARGRGSKAGAQAACLADAIARNPVHSGLRNAAIVHQVTHRNFDTALALAEAAGRAGVADATTFGLLGHALSSLGRHSDAAEAYAEALKLAPEDAYVRHLVAASGILPQAERAAPSYVRAVFDGYAGNFNLHLVSLGYRVPGIIRMALQAHGARGPVLDLGCGTGLLAVACSDLALGPWTGVDISSGMLREAASHGLYADLIKTDVLEALDRPGPAFPVILAGDVLCYFGPLGAVIAAMGARLAPGGLLVLTTEDLRDGEGGCALGRSGRYAHTAIHIAASANAAGLQVIQSQPETLRWEHHVPVAGRLTVLGVQP